MYSFYLIPLLTIFHQSLRISFEYIITFFYNFLEKKIIRYSFFIKYILKNKKVQKKIKTDNDF
jgi:hypothetical protein